MTMRNKTAVRELFGTDGVRGKANIHPMTPEVALQLGRAITTVARRGTRRAPRIVVGKDTRLSGYMFETALASGICAAGGRVLLCGPLPTPAVANLTCSMRADAGVVISASHNPYADNGIKLFGADGFKLPDTAELEIEALLRDPKLLNGPTGATVGRAERLEDAAGRYVVFAKASFPRHLRLDGIKIVVDAAHGAAYRVAPAVFAELGADVICIGCKPNGRNINHRCGALYPEHVAAEVRRHHAAIGIALDGDADRVIIVDEAGDVVDGDAVMAICARRLLEAKTLAKKTVVATVMSNMGLEHALSSIGCRLKRTAVGDRYVVEEMRRSGYSFGGEQSGHLIFLDQATTGDGIVAALQVLAVMLSSGKPMSELAAVMQRVPQVLESVNLPARRALEEMPRLQKLTTQYGKKLGKNGRVLVRWSGTEPKLRVMLEGPDERSLKAMAADMVNAARLDVSAASA